MEDAIKHLEKLVKGFFGWLPKAAHVVLWALSAVIVLPCAFVTHFFFPLWEEWGKEF